MSYESALNLFQHTLDSELRVSTAINLGLMKLVNRDLIEEVSTDICAAIQSGKRVWLTSDLHFGHANIVSYSDRPFFGVPDMTDHHMRLLQKVPQEERIVFLGDMALGGDYQRSVDLIRQIPARKILVAGNHDMAKDGQCELAREKDLFEAVVPFLYWTGSGPIGRLIFFSHYPCAPHPSMTSKITNYHGHLHQKTLEATNQIKYINVGWDVTHSLLVL